MIDDVWIFYTLEIFFYNKNSGDEILFFFLFLSKYLCDTFVNTQLHLMSRRHTW